MANNNDNRGNASLRDHASPEQNNMDRMRHQSDKEMLEDDPMDDEKEDRDNM